MGRPADKPVSTTGFPAVPKVQSRRCSDGAEFKAHQEAACEENSGGAGGACVFTGPTHVPASNDPEQRRLDLASRWLFGYVAPEKTVSIQGPDGKVDRPGLNVRKRPPQNANPSGADEPNDRECRAALAELIWEGELPPEMRWRLAMLFAPTGHELADDEEFLESRRARPRQSSRAKFVRRPSHRRRSQASDGFLRKGASCRPQSARCRCRRRGPLRSQ
jgi:hypothetical protein